MQTRSKASRTRPTKTAAAQDDPDQSRRFLEAAKVAEADETLKGADKAFKAVVKPQKPKR